MTSPFLEHIPDCKKRMRKLRKKIYKHSIAKTEKNCKKQDLSSAIVDIFIKRAIPEAVIQALKNKRNVDIFSLKSLVIGNQESLKWDHKTLKQKTNNQEKQIQQLYKNHRQRMEQIRRNQTPKVRRFRTYIESTEVGFTSNSQQSQNNSYYQSQQRENYEDQHQHSLSHNLFEMIGKQTKIEQNCNDMRPISCFQLGDVNNCFQYGQSSLMSNQNIFNF